MEHERQSVVITGFRGVSVAQLLISHVVYLSLEHAVSENGSSSLSRIIMIFMVHRQSVSHCDVTYILHVLCHLRFLSFPVYKGMIIVS